MFQEGIRTSKFRKLANTVQDALLEAVDGREVAGAEEADVDGALPHGAHQPARFVRLPRVLEIEFPQ